MHIYKITNKVNGKIYIGQTIGSIEKRWGEHCRPRNSHKSALTRAIQKYGKENFSISRVLRCNSVGQLNKSEIMCIRVYNSLTEKQGGWGYNIDLGGRNRIVSRETKWKMSMAAKRRTVSSQQRVAISKTLTGRKLSKHVRDKLTGRNTIPEFSVFEKDSGIIVGKWKSVSKCARDLGIFNNASHISACLKGKQKYCKGYVFKFS